MNIFLDHSDLTDFYLLSLIRDLGIPSQKLCVLTANKSYLPQAGSSQGQIQCILYNGFIFVIKETIPCTERDLQNICLIIISSVAL